MGWDEICEISYVAAMEVLGPKPKPNPRPWLQGKEVELKQLSDAIYEAQRRVGAIKKEGSPLTEEAQQRLEAAKKERERCRKTKRATK